MPPRKRAANTKKPRVESVKSPGARSGTSTSARNWQPWSSGSYNQSQGGNVEQYAEFVNMPVGILLGFLASAALCADWRVMTKDQRFMLLCLFAATMISAFFTLIFSASFIEATASRASSSFFSTTVYWK
ncbi:hypothetical protein R1flu_001538 [Riccia fluitans]|uniref:Uncharacterized protein n=1 Tax=Riccia fluitans TaxID=41844 RepID=A0ABD1Y3T1_9MARC